MVSQENKKGIFIVFEGIDGSGKSTQTKMLSRYLENKGYQVERIDFPQHGEKSSAFVDNYLVGKYGSAEEVGPWRASLFYACDRYDASFRMRQWLNEGKIVIADRYVTSNVGHQGGKFNDKESRSKYFTWLYNLEYELFGIPKQDITIFLKSDIEHSTKLSDKITDQEKQARRASYLKGGKDIHENDTTHLSNALSAYQQAIEEFPVNFQVVECIENGQLLSLEIIHKKVIELINNLIK